MWACEQAAQRECVFAGMQACMSGCEHAKDVPTPASTPVGPCSSGRTTQMDFRGRASHRRPLIASSTESERQSQGAFTLKIMGSGHPVNGVHVEKLHKELGRWHAEREHVLTELQTIIRPTHNVVAPALQ